MDFEIIILIAGVIYYIYANYKKLTEENKKNQQTVDSKPKRPKPVQQKTVADFEWKKPDTAEQVREWQDDVNVFETKYESKYHEPEAPRLTVEKLKAKKMWDELPATTDLINPEVLPEEVLRVNRLHKQHGHYAKIFEEVVEDHPYADFDLRDAIIKSTILHRPQY